LAYWCTGDEGKIALQIKGRTCMEKDLRWDSPEAVREPLLQSGGYQGLRRLATCWGHICPSSLTLAPSLLQQELMGRGMQGLCHMQEKTGTRRVSLALLMREGHREGCGQPGDSTLEGSWRLSPQLPQHPSSSPKSQSQELYA
jgi:hypothetical protein